MILAKQKMCNPVEQWIQLPLFADAEQRIHRSSAVNSQRDLPGWIGFPIRFRADTCSAARGKGPYEIAPLLPSNSRRTSRMPEDRQGLRRECAHALGENPEEPSAIARQLVPRSLA